MNEIIYQWQFTPKNSREISQKTTPLLIFILVLIAVTACFLPSAIPTPKPLYSALPELIGGGNLPALLILFLYFTLAVNFAVIIYILYTNLKKSGSTNPLVYQITRTHLRITDENLQTMSYPWKKFSGFYLAPALFGSVITLIPANSRFPYIYPLTIILFATPEVITEAANQIAGFIPMITDIIIRKKWRTLSLIMMVIACVIGFLIGIWIMNS
jgi:hypothetical protein